MLRPNFLKGMIVINNSFENIFKEYQNCVSFKASLGARGLYEQTEINERFYAGDQWYGAACPSDRPLVRHNVIKRVGDFKMSELVSSKISVRYSAEGIPDTLSSRKNIALERKALCERNSSVFVPLQSSNEIGLMVWALNSYRNTVAKRVRLSDLLDTALKNAFISGSGFIYTYFDPTIRTGLYTDQAAEKQILGDIVSEVVRSENVYFADPTNTNLQSQPYIIISERKPLYAIVNEARLYGAKNLPEFSAEELGRKEILLTKLFKKRNEEGEEHVFAVKATNRFIVRPEWDVGIRIYPLSQFTWETRDNNIYGDSEITYLIPNQIAINRMITAGVWSAMSTGMPLMVVNGELVPDDITNDPGQIIRVWGSTEEIDSAVKYVNPPDYSAGYNESVAALISNTLSQSGATEAALGDSEARNTSAIIELREASCQPLALLKNRYYRFIEDISLIWAEFFVTMYGKRSLKITDENGTWYFPFDSARYRNILMTVSVELLDSVTRSENDSAKLLAELFNKGAITAAQYIKRLPSGLLPDADLLIEQLEAKNYEGN